MKRFLVVVGFVLLPFIIFAQNAAMLDADVFTEMTNAQLRFIKENAQLTKKEYKKFAILYIDYVNALYKLNSSSMPGSQQVNGGPPVFFGMPYDFRPDSRQQENYMKKWNEINETYRSGMEKQLSEDARKRIADAQWQLGQKIWEEWTDRSRRNAQQNVMQYMQYRPEIERHWREMMNNQHVWWNNYWHSWGETGRFDRPFGSDSLQRQFQTPPRQFNPYGN